MQGWLVVGAWVFALLLAAVVLGFTAYELTWKSRRLTAERARLDQLMSELTVVGSRLRDAADRLR